MLESKCQFPDTRIFLCAHNEGKGSAVRIGIREAKSEYLIIQDADMEYNPQDILALMKKDRWFLQILQQGNGQEKYKD